MHAHLFINFCLNKQCHTQYNQNPSKLIVNSWHHRQYLRWGAFHSAKPDSRLLRNLIFIPFTKVVSTHSSIKYFQIFWCYMIDETFSHTYLWKFSKKVSQFLIGRLFKSVNFLLRHPVYINWRSLIPNLQSFRNRLYLFYLYTYHLWRYMKKKWARMKHKCDKPFSQNWWMLRTPPPPPTGSQGLVFFFSVCLTKKLYLFAFVYTPFWKANILNLFLVFSTHLGIIVWHWGWQVTFLYDLLVLLFLHLLCYYQFIYNSRNVQYLIESFTPH